jgi:osmoprotectant transport system ATP-binding protein
MLKINTRVKELLDLVNLKDEMLEKFPHQLSGGQQQRVGVARALAADPKYLLMDEPFGALDPINRAHLQDEFLRIQQKLRKTVIFVTHDMDEALKIGDRIAVMNKGEILQFDKPFNLIKNPSTNFVKNFIGVRDILKTLPYFTVGELPKEYIESSVERVVNKNEQMLMDDTTLHTALEQLLISDHSALPVKNQKNEIIGFLNLRAFQSFLRSRKT